ncbi:MAG: polyprenyl synthetase family protein [Sulfitobacter sp.]
MFQARLDQAARDIKVQFDRIYSDLDALPVVQAMAHATHGGKRLRGFFVLETARLHGVSPEQAILPATAIEVLHAYSLVHDDLPCMDDDDLRRGAPTVHVKWDEATAVLAGDALQALAFELVTDLSVGSGDVRADLAQSLAKAAGAQGMVLGQALDIAAETASSPLSLDQITALQQGKTGALIAWSAMAGARMAQADTMPLNSYASAVGLAFQIADDILDVTGDAATVGKATGKDANAGKATFVSHLGLDGAKRRADELVQSACDALSVYGDQAETLRQAAAFVIARQS